MKCPKCNAPAIEKGNSLHAWHVFYKCGYKEYGTISVDNVGPKGKCKNNN